MSSFRILLGSVLPFVDLRNKGTPFQVPFLPLCASCARSVLVLIETGCGLSSPGVPALPDIPKVRACSCVCVCVSACVYVCAHVCMCVSVCMCLCMRVCARV